MAQEAVHYSPNNIPKVYHPPKSIYKCHAIWTRL